jgi:hypothetical protein
MTSDDLILPGEEQPGVLGRRFAGHDERSREYGLRPLLASRVQRKPTFWALPRSTAFPLDQGEEGACTAFGSEHEKAVGPIHISNVSNQSALSLYREIQAMDRSMGYNFPNGATTLAAMKTLKARGDITGYRWAFGIDDVVDTICTFGPVCLGIEWRHNMYQTKPDGLVVSSGPVVGGHFITAVAYDVHPTHGPVVGWLNSWGKTYGVADTRLNAPGGIGWVQVDTLNAILAADGEAVVPSDFVQSPPVSKNYFAARGAVTFHTRHNGIRRDRQFTTRDEAISEGLRPCKVCRP